MGGVWGAVLAMLLLSILVFCSIFAVCVHFCWESLTRKGQAWSACNKLNNVWQKSSSKSAKLASFRVCVQSVVPYGAKTWTTKKRLQVRLDGTHTRRHMRVQNISWCKHKTKELICRDIAPSCKGHWYRAEHQVVSDVIFWRLLYLLL